VWRGAPVRHATRCWNVTREESVAVDTVAADVRTVFRYRAVHSRKLVRTDELPHVAPDRRAAPRGPGQTSCLTWPRTDELPHVAPDRRAAPRGPGQTSCRTWPRTDDLPHVAPDRRAAPRGPGQTSCPTWPRHGE
jgi:hypothetical protein